MIEGAQDSARCFDAGLALPVNATLKSVTFYYTAGSSAMSFEVNRQNLISHTFVRLVTGTTDFSGLIITYTVPAK